MASRSTIAIAPPGRSTRSASARPGSQPGAEEVGGAGVHEVDARVRAAAAPPHRPPARAPGRPAARRARSTSGGCGSTPITDAASAANTRQVEPVAAAHVETSAPVPRARSRAAPPRSRRRRPARGSPARRPRASSRCWGSGSAGPAVARSALRKARVIVGRHAGTSRLSTHPRHDRGGQQRVEPVHQAAVPRQQGAHVLDAEVALDQRLDEVTERRADHQQRAGQHARPPRSAEQKRTHSAPVDHSGDLRAGEPLPGLLRADRRGHRVPAGEHARPRSRRRRRPPRRA